MELDEIEMFRNFVKGFKDINVNIAPEFWEQIKKDKQILSLLKNNNINFDIKRNDENLNWIWNSRELVSKKKSEVECSTQDKISEVLDKMKDVLIYKNTKYGDSALHPKNVFYKGNSVNSIMIRLDDKIGRIQNNSDDTPRVNDVADIIGYCTLLLVSMGVTEEELEKLKD